MEKGTPQSNELALKYFKLAADQGCTSPQYELAKINEIEKYVAKLWDEAQHKMVKSFQINPRILNTQAQEIDIQTYEEDHNIETLEEIINNYGHRSILGSPIQTSPLFLAFELAGYDPEMNLRYTFSISPFTHNEVIACVFIGNDIKDT